MPMLGYILRFSLVGSVGAILLVAMIRCLSIRIRRRITNALVTFAIGLLRGVTFLALLPTIFSNAPPEMLFGV